MSMKALSGRVGPGLDPCGAIRVPIRVDATARRKEIVFRLGAGLIRRCPSSLCGASVGLRLRMRSLESVHRYWSRTLGTVQVETPDPAFNVLVNGWLVYQVIACRLWGRSGYYQSGGAFGFRDQLQDVMALVHAEPALVREHLLRCRSRASLSKAMSSIGGIRQRAAACGRAVRMIICGCPSWRAAILQPPATPVCWMSQFRFLEGRQVGAGRGILLRSCRFVLTRRDLYEHCVRAIVHGLRFGEHGLPLMGSGDWNDGMNLVGFRRARGKRLARLFPVRRSGSIFASIAQRRGDAAFAGALRSRGGQPARKYRKHGWDGAMVSSRLFRRWLSARVVH